MADKDYEHAIRTENILKLLVILRDIWLKSPDLRLCQLIGNCVGDTKWHGKDLYYLEDDELQEKLINY